MATRVQGVRALAGVDVDTPRHGVLTTTPPRSEPCCPVLLVVDALGCGAAARYVTELGIALTGRGWPVRVACSAGGVGVAALADAGVEVSVVGGEPVEHRVSRRYGEALRELVLEHRPAVVHAHLYASAAAAVRAARELHVPVVLTEHPEVLGRGPRARLVSRLVYRRVDRVVADSTVIRDTLVQRYGLSPGRVEVLLPPTTDPVAHHSSRGPGGTVGVVGRLVPAKGVDVFLRAAALTRGVVPGARFLVVGDGPLRGELEARAGALGLDDVVTFTGFDPDAPRLIAGLDVLAVPSRSDGSPLVVREAMAAGVPVVASRVGGLPDLLARWDSGLLVTPDDPECLARTLVGLLMDPAAARALGARGRELARQRAHARLVDRMTEIYAEAARSTAPA